jgi:small-conductance mechanosensitive channel
LSALLRALLVAALALAAAPARAAPAEPGVAAWSAGVLAGAKTRIQSIGADLAATPQELGQLVKTTRASLMSGTGVRGFTYVVILLFIGIGVEWLYWSYAYAPARAVRAAPASSPGEALRLGLKRLALAGSGLLFFTVATIGASAAFTWPPGVHESVIAATLLVLVLRLAWILLSIVLAPGRAQSKLVPVQPEKARALAAVAMAAVALLALGVFVPGVLERTLGARHVPGALRTLAFTACALVLVVAAFAFFSRPARGAAPRAPAFPRAFVLAAMVVGVLAIWVMNATAATLAAIVAAVIALQLGLREMIYFFWQESEARPLERGNPGPDAAAAQGALPAIALSVARFVVVLAGIGACALALDTPIGALAETVSPWVRIGLRLLGVAVLALLAHGVWIAVRSVIDQRLARIRPADPRAEPDASSRLLTLLPLMRVSTAVVLVVMLVLSSLWALGIEITPLLAGAGVVGLALGFGAQALVRDVIAGIFYLAEDAFRVGEYIESGTNTKGTVERITLRSVALRHHNGPLHFVPYGSLGTVRNTSRDWVIDKFNLPLPIDVDSEKIRKLIKRIGEELQEDPQFGPLIMEPLKGKLYRIDPGVKIFRCKFRTAPGKQFDVRAQALKRIEAALKEIGVSFAELKHTVVVPAPAGA